MTQHGHLRNPVMLAAFEGWNDAGDAASAAIEHLSLAWEAVEFADIVPDSFYDSQVTRPVIAIKDGVTRSFTWPTTHITACTLPNGAHDVLLVRGIEPNFHWRSFCAELMTIASAAHASMVITLGALLADVAHTTPVQLTGSAHDEATADRLGLDHSHYEGPTGVTGALQAAAIAAGIPAVALWAAVPHYVADPPAPTVTLTLLRAVEEALDAEVPVGPLPEQAEEWVTRVSELAAQDDEITEYIHALQERDDAAVAMEVASGDSLAEEFQRYLRRRRPRRGPPTAGSQRFTDLD